MRHAPSTFLLTLAATALTCAGLLADEPPPASLERLNASRRIVCVWKKGTANEALKAIEAAGLELVYRGRVLPVGVCTGRLDEAGLRALRSSSAIQSVEPDVDLKVDQEEAPAPRIDGELLAAYERAGRLVCVWKKGKRAEALDQIRRIEQVEIVYAPEKLPIAVCTWKPPLRAETLRRLMESPGLAYVEPDAPLSADAGTPGRRADEPARTPAPGAVPAHPAPGKPWGIRSIRAPLAWACADTTDVLVAVIDSGIDHDHPDLKPNLWVNAGEVPGNGCDDDKNGFVDDRHGLNFTTLPPTTDTTDRFGHGTHSAGILGAAGNGEAGVAGVCRRVPIMGLKVFDNAGAAPQGSALVAAIDYALARKVRIINLSLRWSDPSNRFLKQAVDGAEAEGVLIVCAAGNLGPGEELRTRDNDAVPCYPASYANDNIIAVANLAAEDGVEGLNPRSHYGRASVDLAAPGTDICSTVPRSVEASGYATKTGTSMAAPHVAGAAALLWGQPRYRKLDSKGLKALILERARRVEGLAGKCVTGGTLDLSFVCPADPDPDPTARRSPARLLRTLASLYRLRCRGY